MYTVFTTRERLPSCRVNVRRVLHNNATPLSLVQKTDCRTHHHTHLALLSILFSCFLLTHHFTRPLKLQQVNIIAVLKVRVHSISLIFISAFSFQCFQSSCNLLNDLKLDYSVDVDIGYWYSPTWFTSVLIFWVEFRWQKLEEIEKVAVDWFNFS